MYASVRFPANDVARRRVIADPDLGVVCTKSPAASDSRRIKGFFDHLNHEWLIRMLEQRNNDRAFLNLIRKWLKAGILELSAEKTPVIKFTRFETENSKSFIFLGFEFRWGRSRKGKPLVKMRTAKKKFRLALAALTAWIKKDRSRLCTAALM